MAPVANASTRVVTLSLMPFYTTEFPPVNRDIIDAVIEALERTYVVKVKLCDAELHNDLSEGNAILDFIARKPGLVMAFLSGPLRAPVRSGVHTNMISVSGWADVPNEDRERPRGSVMTAYSLRNEHESRAAKNLAVVAIHELGHNLGAWDCSNNGCYMNARIDLSANMTPRAFCDKHREILWLYLR